MRIIHITSAKTFGGGEKHLVDLCRGLMDNGHEVFIAIRPTCEWKDKLSFIPPERILEVSIRNSFGLLSSKRIAGFVKRNGIEIIHAHLGRDYITASIVTRLVSALKCVLTRHVLFPLKPFNRFLLANVDCVIAVSEDVRQSLTGVFENKKVTVICNGSDSVPKNDSEREEIRRITRNRLGFDHEEVVIVTVGTLSEVKGQDILLAARPFIQGVDNIRLVIVGEGASPKDPFVVKLRHSAESFAHHSKILFIEKVNDVEGLLSCADVVVSSSRSESFGLVILEAMIAGTPVVATPTRGAVMLLDGGECGFISADFQPRSVGNSINECLREKGARVEKTLNAQRRAKEFFTLNKMVERTERVYRDLIA
jgi:L-malate glycosyltransferase